MLDVFFCVAQDGLSTQGSSEGVELRGTGPLLNPCWVSYMDGRDWWEFSKQERDGTQLRRDCLTQLGYSGTADPGERLLYGVYTRLGWTLWMVSAGEDS